jgi:hypothetical protein
MLRRTKIHFGLGSVLALVIGAATTTAAYASPWDRANSTAQTRSLPTLSADVATGATATKLVSTTVPTNGDLNPYCVAVKPTGVGRLIKGDVLVGNFNDKANAAGTGTSIIEVDPATGRHGVFAALTPTPPRPSQHRHTASRKPTTSHKSSYRINQQDRTRSYKESVRPKLVTVTSTHERCSCGINSPFASKALRVLDAHSMPSRSVSMCGRAASTSLPA